MQNLKYLGQKTKILIQTLRAELNLNIPFYKSHRYGLIGSCRVSVAIIASKVLTHESNLSTVQTQIDRAPTILNVDLVEVLFQISGLA